MAPTLAQDLGVLPQVLAQASGWWFLAFALAQLPVGWALDRIGPRITVAGLMAVAAVGAGVFARPPGAGQINLAMVLIGIGCSPVLMGAYFIFAREFPARQFGTLAGMVIGVGSLGNLAASAPLTWAVALMGWRGAMWGLAAVTLAVALVLAVLVRDPVRMPDPGGRARSGPCSGCASSGRSWSLMAACYAPAAGLRGLWAGPYMAEVFGADAARIGLVTLMMGLAMVAGNLAYGPLERLLNSRKWLNFGGNALSLACLMALMALPGANWVLSAALLAGVGFFGASFPMVIAHGRAFLPPALVGRGVTLMNLFGIGAAGSDANGHRPDLRRPARPTPNRTMPRCLLPMARWWWWGCRSMCGRRTARTDPMIIYPAEWNALQRGRLYRPGPADGGGRRLWTIPWSLRDHAPNRRTGRPMPRPAPNASRRASPARLKALLIRLQYNGARRLFARHPGAVAVAWNGLGGSRQAFLLAARDAGLGTLACELAPFPGRITVDPRGVNAESSVMGHDFSTTARRRRLACHGRQP